MVYWLVLDCKMKIFSWFSLLKTHHKHGEAYHVLGPYISLKKMVGPLVKRGRNIHPKQEKLHPVSGDPPAVGPTYCKRGETYN